MSTELTGPYAITYSEIKIRLAAGETLFVMTLTQDHAGFAWRYHVSEVKGDGRNGRVASGRVITQDYRAAAGRAAQIAAEAFTPGSTGRGLFETLARTEPGTTSGPPAAGADRAT